MKPSKWAKMLIAFGAVCWAAVAFLSNRTTVDSLARAVQAQIENRQRGLDLAKLTGFVWTDLHVFRGPMSRQSICSALQIKGFECWWIISKDVQRGEQFLVFLNKTELVHSERWIFLSEPELLGPSHIVSTDAEFEVRIDNSTIEMFHQPR